MMINDNTMNIYIISVAITSILGIIFTIASIKSFKKEAFI